MKAIIVCVFGMLFTSVGFALDYGRLDLYVYNASQVKNYGEWIEKYTPKDQQAERKEIFKSLLNQKFPAMMRIGDKLFFVNNKENSLERLAIFQLLGADRYVLNGQDISPYTFESTNAWLKRLLKTKEKSAASEIKNFLLPEAHAQGFLFGLFLGLAVASGDRDTTQRYSSTTEQIPPTLENLPPKEVSRLKGVVQSTVSGELDKRFPNLEAINNAKQEMTALVLKQMHSTNDVQCLENPNSKYAGGSFSMIVNGKKMTFTSKPQNELPSLDLTAIEKDNPNNQFVLYYNSASTSFTVHQTTDGQKSVTTGSIQKGDDILAPLAKPFIKDERIAFQETEMNKEETQALIDWANGGDAHISYQLCKTASDEVNEMRYYHRFGNHDAYIDSLNAANRMMDLQQTLEPKVLRQSCKLWTDYRNAKSDYDKREIALNPFGAEWKLNNAKKDYLTQTEKGMNAIPEEYKSLLTNQICHQISERNIRPLSADEFKTSPNTIAGSRGLPIDSFSRNMFDNPRMIPRPSRCLNELQARFAKANPDLAQKTKDRIANAEQNNGRAKRSEINYQADRSQLGVGVKIAEALTACCRMTDCKQAMSAEKNVIEKSKAGAKATDK